MWPEFNAITDPNTSIKDKVSYLQFISQNENFTELDTNSKKLLTHTITRHLDSPITRHEGLLLWLTSIQSSKLYLSNWGSLLESSLTLSDSLSSKKLASEIFYEMIITFKNEPAFLNSFLKCWSHLFKCLKEDFRNNETIFLSIQVIKTAVENFPVYCGPSATEIYAYLFKNMDCESSLVSEAVSDCFSIMPNIFEGQFTFISTWQGLFKKATNSLELQIRDIITFYTGLNGNGKQEDNKEYLPIPCDATEGVPLLLHKVRVFISLSKCLIKLIRSYSPECDVRVEDLLEVLKLVFYLTDEIRTSSGAQFHLIYFSQLCVSSLQILESIILSFHVVEHTDNILAIILKLLNNEKIDNKPIHSREVRLHTWKFLGTWIKQYGISVSPKVFSKEMVGTLIADVSKDIEDASPKSQTLETQICLQALKVLGGFIETSGTFIDENNLKFICNRLLERARYVQLNFYTLKKINPPYSDEDCRLELYSLLFNCCCHEHFLKQNCFRRSIRIFEEALKDISIEVITLARRANNYFNAKKHPPDITIPIHKESTECPANVIPGFPMAYAAGSWEQEQLNNGGAEPMEMQQIPPAMYQVEESSYQQTVVDSDHTQERPSDRESPPLYQELQPASQYNNLKTYSRGSSRSDSMDNSVEEEILDEEENVHSQHSYKQKASIPAESGRPNIQMLKAHTRMQEYADDEAEVQDVQSDHDSLEEGELSRSRSFVAENGAVEDSEEEDEEAFDEDEAEEEYEEANEERFSPEPEERPIKKLKKDEEIVMNLEEEVSSEEEGNKLTINTEEIVESKETEDIEEESKPEVNGEKAESPSETENDPTVDEMMSDLVVAEPDS